MNTLQVNNLRKAGAEAVKCWQSTGLPAEFILAQWALESGWGEHSPGNNCFGIKDYEVSAGRQLLWTYEYFTPEELTSFLKVAGRTAAPYATAQVRADGRRRYRCQDWFATFDTLAACFNRRAQLFLVTPYYSITRQYQVDGDLSRFIYDTCQKYATADPHSYMMSLQSIMSMQEVEAVVKMCKSLLDLPQSPA